MGTAGIAAPMRDHGGLVVGAIGITGPVERLCDGSRAPRPALVAPGAGRCPGDLPRAGAAAG